MHKCEFPNGVSLCFGDIPVDPCRYEIVEIHKNVTVEVLRCPKCGDVSISWHRQCNTEDILIDESEER